MTDELVSDSEAPEDGVPDSDSLASLLGDSDSGEDVSRDGDPDGSPGAGDSLPSDSDGAKPGLGAADVDGATEVAVVVGASAGAGALDDRGAGADDGALDGARSLGAGLGLDGGADCVAGAWDAGAWVAGA